MRLLIAGDEPQLDVLLMRHANSSMFLRSNIQYGGIVYGGALYQGEYFGAFDQNGKLVAVLGHFWNGNVIVQADNLQSANATPLIPLVTSFKRVSSRPVAGVLGPVILADQVISELQLNQQKFDLFSKENLYSLTLDSLVIPETDPGRMAHVSEVEPAILERWMRTYSIEALGKTDDVTLTKNMKKWVRGLNAGSDIWVYLNKDQPVCMSGFNARLSDMVQVGPVFTPLEFRSRGFARTLVALTLENARKNGATKAILFTNNPFAARAYQAIGFQRIGDYRLALLNEAVIFDDTNKGK